MRKYALSFLFLCGLLFLSSAALQQTRLSGDGGEYLLMTHALFKHGSVTIGAADVADYAHMAPDALEQLGFYPAMLAELLRQAQSGAPEVVNAGFFPTAPGQFYAIHFWLYSLLALPFYALLKPFGVNPTAAFVLLNLACAGGVFAFLRRAVPRHAALGFLVFLAAGTCFYLKWTGPELMTASCALVATLAMLRGDAGLAILLAGVGASQNPPLLFMMPFAVLYRLLLAKWPALGWPGQVAPPVGKATVLAALAGAALALAPMAFFQMTFGVPSLIAKYMASGDYVTARRFLSLYLDLDQGMIVGVPALLVFALLLPPLLLARERRGAWLWAAAFTLSMTVVMSLPALSASNWNSGCSVFVRYAYWLAMPVLALALRAAAAMEPRRAMGLLLPILLGQAAVVASYDVFGEETLHTRHSFAGAWILDHRPSLYNPDAEIFMERELGHEIRITPDMVQVHRAAGTPVKLLRHWSNFDSSGGLCPQGQLVQGGSVRNVDGGWQYLHAPFTCVAPGTDAALAWRLNGAQADNKKLLGNGWSGFEETGVWSDGKASELALPVPAGRQALVLRMQGNYYSRDHETDVSVNGRPLGRYNLTKQAIELPGDVRQAARLAVTLRHVAPESPKARGESPDQRLLGFYLQTIVVETAAR